MAERTPSDTQAAFGVFPQLKRNRSKQDREAAKNVPVDLARGAVAGVLGAPGDIESLVRMLPYIDEKTILPTSEDIEKKLPFRSDTPVSRAATGLGTLGGGFYYGPGSPLKVVGALPSAIKHGAEEFAKASVAGAPHVIKPKGGNWIGNSVEKSLEPLLARGVLNNQEIPYGPQFDVAIRKRIEDLKQKASDPNYVGGAKQVAEHLERDLQNPRVNEVALNKWVQSNLTNYVKKEMGTPEDPVRKLAEQGVSHLPKDLQNLEMTWTPEELAGTRKRFGFPEEETATHPTAKMWEQMADEMIGPHRASDIGENLRAQNTWLEKLNPDDPVYKTMRGLPQALKFDHILDVLRQDVEAGRIRPDQLNKVSMEQAVRRTAEFDEEMARKMAEAQLKVDQGLPVRKEYPEGYKWQELRHTDDAATEAALKYEGNTMGHCVGGYCPDVLAGRTRIFSLRDAKGEPHVTVETRPEPHPIGTSRRGDNFPELSGFEYGSQHTGSGPYKPTSEQKAQIHNRAQELWSTKGTGRARDIDQFYQQASNEILGPMPEQIVQIKGKGNAKPKADYIPYVQDFVKSGNWSDVGDIKNTDLYKLDKDFLGQVSAYMPEAEDIKHLKQPQREEAILKAMEANELKSGYITRAEYENAVRKYGTPTYGEVTDDLLRQLQAPIPPTEGMKRGGVAISHNPDTMMMAVNNQKMAPGGLVKGLVKAAKTEVPIKFPVSRGPSVEEIRAMAERMAPQVLGEFVRAAPTPSNPKPSTSVVGKTQKQFEREKTLPIEYENIKPEVTPQEFDYAKNKNALLIGAQGDVTPGNRMLVSIDEQPLSSPVHLQAGPEWALYNPSGWAASDQMAKTYMKRAGQAAEAYDAEPLLHYHKMTPDANFYAMHHLNSVLGHLRPEELMLRDPKLYKQMVEEIRTRDVGYGKHPEFEGFEDPLNLQVHAQIDPNFRRHLGAIFNGPTFTKRYGLNSGQDVMAATSLPELRDLEAGASGYAVVPLDVKAPLKHFEAESQTYDTGFPMKGEPMRSKYPSPYQLIYRDTLNWMKENPSANKSSEFGRMNMIVPKQQIDDELIDAIGEYQRRMKELTGKKKGGTVHKADGGAITGDDLIIEERPL